MDYTSDCKHTHPLAALISQEIQRSGVISFARFMQLALYHPEHGYYNRNNTVIGRSGDFFTSVSVGPLFGQMVAFWLQREGVAQIVEAGAHDGKLAADILGKFEVPYTIIEPSPRLQVLQRQTLANFKNVRWLTSIEELEDFDGALISNELLDAFPVHVFRWSNGRWHERGVGNNLEWVDLPAVAQLNLGIEEHLPPGFTIELSPAAEHWWETAARKLQSGVMLAIDYGDEAASLWKNTSGTLRAYRDHKSNSNVLANPGEQDITASVNFTKIREAGERAGLTSEPLVTQSTFLVRLARSFFGANPDPKQVRQFQTLTHPEHLGRAFKVFVQRTCPR